MSERPTDAREEMAAGGVPHGVEVLLIEASINPEFRKLLLEKRADAAGEIGVELTAAEAAMLNGVPKAQLELTIRETRVSKKLRAQRRRKAAKVALAVLSVGAMKLGLDQWVKYEHKRELDRLKQLAQQYCVSIAGLGYVGPPTGYGYTYPVAEPSSPEDRAGEGERQAKDLSSDGE